MRSSSRPCRHFCFSSIGVVSCAPSGTPLSRGSRRTRTEGTLTLVHLPVHASWLNQVEIYHSIIQRKVLDPNDFEDTAQLARTLNDFERRYNEVAQPFAWNFTRHDLSELLARLEDHHEKPSLSLAA